MKDENKQDGDRDRSRQACPLSLDSVEECHESLPAVRFARPAPKGRRGENLPRDSAHEERNGNQEQTYAGTHRSRRKRFVPGRARHPARFARSFLF